MYDSAIANIIVNIISSVTVALGTLATEKKQKNVGIFPKFFPPPSLGIFFPILPFIYMVPYMKGHHLNFKIDILDGILVFEILFQFISLILIVF